MCAPVCGTRSTGTCGAGSTGPRRQVRPRCRHPLRHRRSEPSPMLTLDVLPAGSLVCSSTARMVWAWATSDVPPSSRRSSCGPRQERAPSPCPTRRSGGSSPRGSATITQAALDRKAGPGDWRAVSLPPPFPDVLAMRGARCCAARWSYQPHILLVDHMPHGAMGELVPTLEALRGHADLRIVLGLRDILDAPAVVRRALAGRGRATTRSSATTTPCWCTASATCSTSLPSTTGRRQPSSGSSTAAMCAHPVRARGCSVSGSESCVERPARGWW